MHAIITLSYPVTKLATNIIYLAMAVVRVYQASQLMETGSLGRECKAGGASKRFTVNSR
jgi:hypothetical protein